ncbi:MAG: hypothetical protein K9L57_09765 [Spirochaetaceae bacterium]|nr:hypothetical protein [Spirochaetaceae bacterium]
MKVKLFLFVILVILIGGAAFYFGWIQFQLEEHSYGVVFSKTSGYEQEVVRPGEFNWRWEALIPTNLTLHEIEVLPQSIDIEKSGSLPSGSVYSQAVEVTTDFEYSLVLSLSYSLQPEQLPQLVKEEALTVDTLDGYYQKAEQRMGSIVNSYVENRIISKQDITANDFKMSAVEAALIEKLQDAFSHFEIHSLNLIRIEMPDIDLYQAARSYYFNILETRQETEAATLRQEREWIVSQESKLEVLKKYGKLFTEYPGLIQYMALQKNQDLQQFLPEVDLIPSSGNSGSAEKQETE